MQKWSVCEAEEHVSVAKVNEMKAIAFEGMETCETRRLQSLPRARADGLLTAGPLPW